MKTGKNNATGDESNPLQEKIIITKTRINPVRQASRPRYELQKDI